MSAMSSQITNRTSVYSAVYSRLDERKHQSSAPLAFLWGIHQSPVNSPHKWPVSRKMFSFDDVIMQSRSYPFWILLFTHTRSYQIYWYEIGNVHYAPQGCFPRLHSLWQRMMLIICRWISIKFQICVKTFYTWYMHHYNNNSLLWAVVNRGGIIWLWLCTNQAHVAAEFEYMLEMIPWYIWYIYTFFISERAPLFCMCMCKDFVNNIATCR